MLTRLLAHLSHRRQRERGQALVLVTLLLAVIGGMTAIAVDVGSYSADRRDLQNAADAIALAASLELPDADAAQAAADEWAVKNDIDPASMTVTVTPQNLPSEPNPKVRVVLERDHNFTFAKMIGITSSQVDAAGTAIKTSAGGGGGMVPLSVTEEALNGVGLGDDVVLKYDANNISQGNTSPIRIDGPGTGNCTTSDSYCDGIRYGSENTVCAEGADLYCSGPTEVDTQTGNVVSGTRTGIEERLLLTDSHCDTFDEVFEDDPTSNVVGDYRIIAACNPFLAGGYDSYRVLIIPVIQELCNGSCTVTIVDFALFFLQGFPSSGNGNGNGNSQSCTGNQCEVIGQFVRVNQNVGLLAGVFDEQSLNSFVRLID